MQRALRLHSKRLCRQTGIRLYSAQAALALKPAGHDFQEPAEDIAEPQTDASSSRLPEIPKKHKRSRGKPVKVVEISSSDVGDSANESSRHDISRVNRVDEHLAALRVGGIEPRLEDLERCRPRKRPHGNSPGYADAYNNLVDRLCRTFSKSQLRRLGKEYCLPWKWTRSGRRKAEYAESIIEKQWGWENLNELAREKRDTSEVVVKSYPVSASELFLLLGKDGRELLQMSVEYNVHISVEPEPLSVCIEGFRGAMERLDLLINSKKTHFVEETVELPSNGPLTPSLLQQISRLANAYVENVGSGGKIRICASSEERLEGAKRLAVRAIEYENHASCIPLLSFVPPEDPSFVMGKIPASYALYPFLPYRSLPWTVKTGGTFRVRRVGEWLGEELGEDARQASGLANGGGSIISEAGPVDNLQEVVNNAFPADSGIPVVTASTGHILFSDKSRARSSILPPLAGAVKLPNFLKWVNAGHVNRFFVHSLPMPLHDAPPISQKVIHRLAYRSVSLDSDAVPSPTYPCTKFIDFEMTINEQEGTEGADAEVTNLRDDQSGSTWSDGNVISEATTTDPPLFGEDDGIVRTESSQEKPEVDLDHESEIPPNEDAGLDILGESCCRVGNELELFITFPNRPMDMKLSVRQTSEVHVTDNFPQLHAYSEALRDYLSRSSVLQPRPPLLLTHGGTTYTLETNTSVRRSIENVDVTPPYGFVEVEPIDRHVVSTVSESILDLETNQKTITCDISCIDPSSSDAWQAFLKNCDAISRLVYKQSSRSSVIGEDKFV